MIRPRWAVRPDTLSAGPTSPTPAGLDRPRGVSTPASGPRYGDCDHCASFSQVVDGPDALVVCTGCRDRFRRAKPESVEQAVALAETRLAAVQHAIAGVDAKAALTATVQTAGLAGLLTRPTGGWLGVLGLVVLLAALGLSGAVVLPRLAARRDDAQDVVWFGQFRRWRDPALLAARLHHLTREPTLRLLAVARQLQATSRIAHTKHQALRASLLATGLAVAVHAVSVLI